MRVIHVSAYFAPAFKYGGPPRSILGLCKGLRRAGVDVEVFTTTADGKADFPPSPPEGDIYEGVPVRYFPRTFPRRFFRSPALGQALKAAARRCDLLHIHGLWNQTVWSAARLARRLGVPYVVSPRGMLNPAALRFRSLRKRLFYRLLERGNLAGAAALHATSNEEAKWLRAFNLGVEVFVSPNGLELDRVPTAPPGAFRRRLGVGDDACLVVFLGRIHRIKRLDILADAFLHLRAGHGTARLVLAGPFEDADYRRELERRLAPVAGAVTWTGELDQAEKWSLLADADVLAACSDQESFGMSIVEALSAGVPVVVTKTCPWQEVEAAGCGFWVEQEAGMVAAALDRLLEDPAAARAMGERGRRLVETCYGWDSIARRMAAQYGEAKQRSNPVRGGRGSFRRAAPGDSGGHLQDQ